MLHGEVTIELLDGRRRRVGPGGAFCTPLDDAAGELPPRTRTAVGAWHGGGEGKGAAAVMVWALDGLSKAASEARRAEEEAMARIEAERNELKAKLRQLEGMLQEAQLRLGVSTRKEPRERWLWAYRKVRSFGAFGVDPSTASAAAATASSGSLESQLVSVQEQMLHYDGLLGERAAQLRALEATWDAHTPPIFAEEGALPALDREPYDLSLARLAEASAAVDGLLSLRRARRAELLEELRELWARFDTPRAPCEAVEARVRDDLTGAAFDVLFDELSARRAHLAAPMAGVQQQLQAVWGALQIPQEVRAPYVWREGDALTLAVLRRCEEELTTLQLVAARLRPLLSSATNQSVLGMATALLHSALVRRTGGGGQGGGAGGGDGDGGEDEDDALLSAAESLQATLRAEAERRGAEVDALQRRALSEVSESSVREAALREHAAALERRLSEAEAEKAAALERLRSTEDASSRMQESLASLEREAAEKQRQREAARAAAAAAAEGAGEAIDWLARHDELRERRVALLEQGGRASDAPRGESSRPVRPHARRARRRGRARRGGGGGRACARGARARTPVDRRPPPGALRLGRYLRRDAEADGRVGAHAAALRQGDRGDARREKGRAGGHGRQGPPSAAAQGVARAGGRALHRARDGLPRADERHTHAGAGGGRAAQDRPLHLRL